MKEFFALAFVVALLLGNVEKIADYLLYDPARLTFALLAVIILVCMFIPIGRQSSRNGYWHRR